MIEDFDAVAAVIDVYFDGLYESDTRRLRRAFHRQAIYVSPTGGEFLYRDMETYFAVVDKRPSPKSKGEVRRDSIRSIEFAGPDMARAVVHCAIGDKYFTDYLTFVRADGEWRIMAKVFHHDPIPQPA